MGELSTVGPELLAELEADAPEALRSAVFQPYNGTAQVCRVVPETLKHYEIDGEAVQATDSVWLVFQHQLTQTPEIDDTLLIGTETYHVYRVVPNIANVYWSLYTRA